MQGKYFLCQVLGENTGTTYLAEELDGVGPALAAAIVRDREENGPYTSAEEITRVRGIGGRVLADNRNNILIDEEAPAED